MAGAIVAAAPAGPLIPRPASPLAAAAAAIIPELRHAGQVDRLRVDHLGYRRRRLIIPPIRPVITGSVDTPDPAAVAWAEALADLASVTESRELEAPP